MIYNTHSHLFDNDESVVSQVLDKCKEFNVTKINAIGIDLKTSQNAIKYARKYSNIYAICGIQPEEIDYFDGNYEPFIELYKESVAVGEIGLDYHYTKDNKERQIEIFEKQIQIAISLNKPIVIHCRDAYADTYNILKKYYKELKGILFHCYSGSLEMAKEFIKLGAYISISGVVTFKNAISLVEVVKNISLDRLMVETDDPYLAPTPFRGKENYPYYVTYVVSKIAEIKNMDLKEVEDVLYKTSMRFFKNED